MRGTTGHTKTQVEVSDAKKFEILAKKLHARSPCKKTKISFDSFTIIDDPTILQFYWRRGTTDHTQPKVKVLVLPPLHGYFLAKKIWYRLIPSRDIDNQIIL